MPAELVKDILEIDEIKGMESVQTLLESEIYLDQSKPEIEKILWTDSKAEIVNVKVIKDLVVVSGFLSSKVIYKPNDEHIPIAITENKVDFKEEINMIGITEDMIGKVKALVAHVEHEIVEGRKIILETLINLKLKVIKANSIEIIKDIKGGEGLQILKEKIKYKRVLGSNESQTIIREAFEIRDILPDIDEVFKFDTRIYVQETKVVEGKIIASGIILATIIYYGGEKLNTVKREIAFNHFIDVEGAIRDADCDLVLEIVDGDYEIKEDIEGSIRIIDMEVKVKASGEVYEIEEKEFSLDAYSTMKNINLNMKEIELVENVSKIKYTETIRASFGETGFTEVYHVDGIPILIDSRIVEGKVVLEGILNLNIIYLDSHSKEVRSISKETPFKTYLDDEGLVNDMKADVDIKIEKIDYEIEGNELVVDTQLQYVILLKNSKTLNIILDLEETEQYIDKRNRPSITIYIVQKNDTLWDIAKRYNTTVEELMISNNITTTNNLMPGEKIVIEKIVNMDF